LVGFSLTGFINTSHVEWAMKDQHYILVTIVVGIILIISIFYLAKTSDILASPDETGSVEIIIPTFESIPEQTMDCKLCHIHPETLTNHMDGGEYCLKCHESDIHNIHLKDNTNDSICNACHGNNQTIPKPLPDHTVICDTCHDYPNPSQPSYGNIITIHMTRGYSCTICHIQDIQNLHEIDSLNRSTIK
jgi:hypothetical protein